MSLDYWQYFIDSFKDAKTVISLALATFSFISLFFTRRFWLATNRPIISASIVSNEPGNVATSYNLVVYNTGNRPATSIRLFADQSALDKIIDSGYSSKRDNLRDGLYRRQRKTLHFRTRSIIVP
jgi:hypothetical protein